MSILGDVETFCINRVHAVSPVRGVVSVAVFSASRGPPSCQGSGPSSFAMFSAPVSAKVGFIFRMFFMNAAWRRVAEAEYDHLPQTICTCLFRRRMLCFLLAWWPRWRRFPLAPFSNRGGTRDVARVI